MKKYLIIFFMLFISSAVLAQWSGEINLSQFTLPSQCKLNACVDVNGIHLVYQHNGGIKYARANYNGSTVYYYDRVIESEGSNCDFVNILSVNNNYLYAIYKKNNTINVKRSVNLGSSWSQYSYYNMTNTGCDKIVAYNDGVDIHIGWTENSGYINSYYIKFVTAPSPNWTYYKEVTDQEYDGGYDPDLTVSQNKIHYLYKDVTSDSHSRDKVKDSPNWDSPQTIPFDGTSVQYHKPTVANNEINAALRVYYSFFSGDGAYISNSDRPFDQAFWNDYVWLRESKPGYETEVESTVDNKIHFIYFDKYDNKWEHRYMAGTTLSGQVGEIPLVAFPYSTLIANSNDLYLLALGSISTPTWIKLRRYDVAPAPPQNLTVSKSANNHPLLSWNSNTEPDKNYYIIYKSTGGWHQVAQTNSTSYEDVSESYCTAVPPQQCLGGHYVYYYVKAMDLGNHLSDQSNTVGTYVNGAPPDKISAGPETEVPDEYSLSQNYPNPFNPTTKIDYQIKDKGFVSLKVFDMLGREVADLVNGTKDVGQYSVEFDAKNLPSGVYIYSLKVNDFVQINKMTLLK